MNQNFQLYKKLIQILHMIYLVILISTNLLEVFNIDFYSKEYLFVFPINSMGSDPKFYLMIFFCFYFSYKLIQFLLYLHLRMKQNGSSGWKNIILFFQGIWKETAVDFFLGSNSIFIIFQKKTYLISQKYSESAGLR